METLHTTIPARDRQRRQIRPPIRYAQADVIDEVEPRTFQEGIVVKSTHKQKWMKAMDEEIDSLKKNKTWELVPKPKAQKIIGSK